LEHRCFPQISFVGDTVAVSEGVVDGGGVDDAVRVPVRVPVRVAVGELVGDTVLLGVSEAVVVAAAVSVAEADAVSVADGVGDTDVFVTVGVEDIMVESVNGKAEKRPHEGQLGSLAGER
jgi:hypothetical protein